jgi:non-reducing end alpha-L-arabinofuranosidase
MADYEAGVWAGGSKTGDPGWGDLTDMGANDKPPNPKNPSLPVKFAIGFLKTDTNYALRMADVSTATMLTTAYEGPLPKPMDNQGAVVIGVGGDNSNNSWGTFYEGAIVAGYPTAATEDAVMQNVKAVGYGR